MHSPELPRPDTDPDGTFAGTAGEAVAHYLHAQAADFLRSLRRHGESGAETAVVAESARALRIASRRNGGTLHTFRPLLDPAWADDLRTELVWLSTTLAQEHACMSRLSRLLDALSRLSGTSPLPHARGETLPLPERAGADTDADSTACAGSTAVGAPAAEAGSSAGTGSTAAAAGAGGAPAPRGAPAGARRASAASAGGAQGGRVGGGGAGPETG
ncbi:CHAD domain-containing protein, partial [Streptomyces sp. NPDC054802]